MEREDFSSHVSEHLNRNLEGLFNQVLEMGGLVEQQLSDLSKALNEEDAKLARSSLQLDNLINREEMEIDRLCAAVLARQQPTASDLRLIVMAIRVAIDLERMGDESVKIAKLALTECEEYEGCREMPAYSYLRTIMECSRDMIQKTLNAFSHLDTADVLSVYDDEEKMDHVLKDAIKHIEEELSATSDIRKVETLIQMLFAIRAAERITDHALNIAENVVYLVKGKDVRNMDMAALEQLLNNGNNA